MKKIISLFLLINLLISNLCIAQTFHAHKKYPPLSEFYIDKDINECINRKIFNFNLKMNKLFAKKIHTLWATLVPNFIIDSLNMAYSNIEYPKRVISSLLQRDIEAIKHETKRFLINTTLGVAGLIDIANKLFNLELYDEDMEQALAKCKCKCGKYLVMPFISSTTTRDLFGRILDFTLNPTTYITTPITAAIKAGLLVNRTAYIQPMIKMVESNFIDPYDIARKFFGIEKYIKLSNYDRKNVIENIKNDFNDEIELVDTTPKENLNVKGKLSKSENLIVNEFFDNELNADIILADYNPQNPILDSMRTALFDLKESKKYFWNELSLWNRNFNKKIKTGTIEILKNYPKYNYKYILQKNKQSPLVIIFPSIGEGVNNSHSSILAKMFYDEGYSAIILGSHFQWEFLKSIDNSHHPGDIKTDIKYINLLVNNIIKNLSKKYDRTFLSRTALGTSLGAYTVLFLANEQYEIGANNIDKFIAICPPYELFYAINKIDKIIDSWKNKPEDFKEILAQTTAKVIRAFKNKKELQKNIVQLPFTNYEAKLISGFIFHQKLSDLIYAIETRKNPEINKKELYEMISNSNFMDYTEKYLLANHTKEELENTNTLNSISNYLINKDNYKIFHSIDDYLTNKSQLKELKGFCDDKLILFNNGSHLGFLYRDEFIQKLKSEIKLTDITSNS
ncbi:MAG: VacJ family lipoprotein [Candidatus Gastranaerophilales bacterium]|nr:VacJ family lipoprotein [Candidatus Gastranaerophilales bacterium]